MTWADSRLIYWLLHETKISRYQISKDTGISESTLSRIFSGDTPLERVQFGYAHTLTEYARVEQDKLTDEEKAKLERDGEKL